ncbi:MAG: helix-turn-helix transcriptional regulator [Lachnospiraceae bacterium]|nr:helix-turn-helix transcriptional regulator [Lachnospiraceae bacterium]
MIADRIRTLRESNGMTQAALAKKLGITRSSVNAWEMGISAPSTTYLVELASLFNVSTDYLLGRSSNNTIDVSDLNETEIMLVHNFIQYFQSQKTFSSVTKSAGSQAGKP